MPRVAGEHGYQGQRSRRSRPPPGSHPEPAACTSASRARKTSSRPASNATSLRLETLRDIRRVLTPLGDLQAELTLTARYILAELDSESELLRILASAARNEPPAPHQRRIPARQLNLRWLSLMDRRTLRPTSPRRSGSRHRHGWAGSASVEPPRSRRSRRRIPGR